MVSARISLGEMPLPPLRKATQSEALPRPALRAPRAPKKDGGCKTCDGLHCIGRCRF
jgi:hypothetical protein